MNNGAGRKVQEDLEFVSRRSRYVSLGSASMLALEGLFRVLPHDGEKRGLQLAIHKLTALSAAQWHWVSDDRPCPGAYINFRNWIVTHRGRPAAPVLGGLASMLQT